MKNSLKKFSAIPNISKGLLTASLTPAPVKVTLQTTKKKKIVHHVFTSYLAAHNFKVLNKIKREIKKTGQWRFEV